MRHSRTFRTDVDPHTKGGSSTGKRNAVGNKSRSTVANSALVLRRPTSPPTAGRKPEASPPTTPNVDVDVAVGVAVGVAVAVDVAVGGDALTLQLKSWNADQSNARNTLSPRLLDDLDISELRKFFALIDQWDRRDN